MKRIALVGIAAAFALVAAGMSTVAAEDSAGKTAFIANKCNSCHAVKSQGIAADTGGEAAAEKPEPGEVAPPDLSDVGTKLKGDFLKAYLVKKETIEGRKHRKKFAGTEPELATLTDWMLTLKAAAPAAK